MDSKEFREFSNAVTEYIINYRENIRSRNVYPSVEAGYLFKRLPNEMPDSPDDWKAVLDDVEKHIMPGITHWQSPRFHAFFPSSASYPSIVGELLSAGLGVLGFSWITSPACTELELIVMDWLGKLIGLPPEFLNSSDSPGGGIIQGSASEATLIGLLAAKDKTTRRIKTLHPDMDENDICCKLVAYSSDQSNSSVEKAGLLGSVPMRLLKSDSRGKLCAETLQAAFDEDKNKGLIPCYVVATLGTTGTLAFDNLEELGPICQKEKVWVHVDAAYAGGAFVCPEYQHLMAGIEYVDSIDINLHKWLLVNFDCSAMWVKNLNDLSNAFNVERIYLEHKRNQIPEMRNLQIPLGRRFRALKMWFTLRLYGASGLQAHVRNDIALVKYFEELVDQDDRFEVVIPAMLGLVCFRLKGENSLNRRLLDKIHLSRQLYMVPATVGEKFVIRFVNVSLASTRDDIKHDWNFIQTIASSIIEQPTLIIRAEKRYPSSDKLNNGNIVDICMKDKLTQELCKYSHD